MPSAPAVTAPGDDDELRVIAAQVAHEGIAARQLRQVIALLTDDVHTLETLVRATGLPRRSVESLLQVIEPDLALQAGGIRLRQDRVGVYRERFGYQQLSESRLADPLRERLRDATAALAQAEADIAAAPAAREALDHVSATAQTALRRALWLDSSYDLAGARLLCAGDHDLTSLAVCAVSPGLEVTVVDLDERILEFIDRQAAARGYSIRCLFADFRFGLPETAAEWADLVFTDPPFTPEGVAVFLARGLQALRDHKNGRLIMACGYSRRQPALGLKIQRAAQDLHLVFEAILPGFNRYHGGQAVGSASDLYVLQPTAAAWQGLDRRAAAGPANIYTRGARSLEGAVPSPGDATGDDLRAAASGPDRLPVTVVAGDAPGASTASFPADASPPSLPADASPPSLPAGKSAASVSLPALLGSGVPQTARGRPVVVSVDLRADPGAWLLRALLAVNADRVALLVPNNHPDLATQTAQGDLIRLVQSKYALRLRRSTPDSKHAIVEAVPASMPASPGGLLERCLLERAHGKVGNVWREALIRLSSSGPGPILTKNDARSAIRQAVVSESLLGMRLIDLPRHQLCGILAAAAESAAAARG